MKIKLLTALVGSALLAGCNSSSSSDAPEVAYNTPITFTVTDYSMSLNRSKTCGVSNLDIYIHDANGNHVNTLVTNADGSIFVGDIPAGHYFTAVPDQLDYDYDYDYQDGWELLNSYQKELVRMPTRVDLRHLELYDAGDSCVVENNETGTFEVRLRLPEHVEIIKKGHLNWGAHAQKVRVDQDFDSVVYRVPNHIDGLMLVESVDPETYDIDTGLETIKRAHFIAIEDLQAASEANAIYTVDFTEIDTKYTYTPVDLKSLESDVETSYVIGNTEYFSAEFILDKTTREVGANPVFVHPDFSEGFIIVDTQDYSHYESGFSYGSERVLNEDIITDELMDVSAYSKFGHPSQPENYTFQFEGFTPHLSVITTEWKHSDWGYENSIFNTIYSVKAESATIPQFHNIGQLAEGKHEIKFTEFESGDISLVAYAVNSGLAVDTASDAQLESIRGLEQSNIRWIRDEDQTPGFENPICGDDDGLDYEDKSCPETPVQLPN